MGGAAIKLNRQPSACGNMYDIEKQQGTIRRKPARARRHPSQLGARAGRWLRRMVWRASPSPPRISSWAVAVVSIEWLRRRRERAQEDQPVSVRARRFTALYPLIPIPTVSRSTTRAIPPAERAVQCAEPPALLQRLSPRPEPRYLRLSAAACPRPRGVLAD